MTLVVATYNVRRGGRGRADRLADVLAPFDPDLVILQEAVDPGVVARIAERLDLGTVIARRGTSVAALSRLPITGSAWHADGPGHAFLEVRLAAPSVRVIGVHLAAGLSMRGERRRLRQTDGLLGLASVPGSPTMLVGDFNAVAPGDAPFVRTMPLWIRALLRFDGGFQMAAMSTLQQAGLVDAFRRCHPAGTGATLPAGLPRVRLDYLMLDASLAGALIGCRVPDAAPAMALASDHLPVVAEFELAG